MSDKLQSLKTDGSGNRYDDVSNVRLTYVSKEARSDANSWSKGDVLRVQAYRGNGNQLHLGAELDLRDPGTILELIEALARLYRAESMTPPPPSANDADDIKRYEIECHEWNDTGNSSPMKVPFSVQASDCADAIIRFQDEMEERHPDKTVVVNGRKVKSCEGEGRLKGKGIDFVNNGGPNQIEIIGVEERAEDE